MQDGQIYGKIEDMELECLKRALQGVADPRRTERGHILHKPEDIIIIGLCILVCHGEDFADREAVGELGEEWLRQFLELPHGIPDSETFRRVFGQIEPEALGECLYDWLGCHWEKDTVVAIDRKIIRGSKSRSRKAYHVVSAFAAENQLALGELVTEEKPNEVTAVPELTLTRFFITSLTDMDRFAYAVRKRWAIENQLHWCLDVIFDEDSSRARKDMSPLNLNALRKTALALCKHADLGPRVSMKR